MTEPDWRRRSFAGAWRRAGWRRRSGAGAWTASPATRRRCPTGPRPSLRPPSVEFEPSERQFRLLKLRCSAPPLRPQLRPGPAAKDRATVFTLLLTAAQASVPSLVTSGTGQPGHPGFPAAHRTSFQQCVLESRETICSGGMQSDEIGAWEFLCPSRERQNFSVQE